MSAAVDMDEKRRLIGSGGFGVVLKPALPNKGIEFPSNVTKVFYRKSARNAAVATAASITSVMGEPDEGHRVTPYAEDGVAGNLPANAFAQMKLKVPDLTPTTPLHMVRMPDLGVDVAHLSPDNIRAIRLVPFGVILSQIRKVVRQVATLAKNGVGHFDVRSPNVMVNPATGAITLIDFDWMRPLRDLFHRYAVGYYSFPPESLFVQRLSHRVLDSFTTDEDVIAWLQDDDSSASAAEESHAAIYDAYVKTNLTFLADALMVRGFHSRDAYRTNVTMSNVRNVEFFRDMPLAAADAAENAENLAANILKYSLATFDSYGLAMTLLQFLRKVYGVDSANVKPGGLPALIKLLETAVFVGGSGSDGGSNSTSTKTKKELVQIATALARLTNLAIKASSHLIRDRLRPSKFAAGVDEIVAAFDSAVAGGSSETAAAVGGAGTMRGGGCAATKTEGTNRMSAAATHKAKATLPSSMQPANPYDKGTPERLLFGMFVNWFYYARGPFPDDSANSDGAVPLARLMSTATARKFVEKHPAFADPARIREVLEGAFEVTADGRVKALPHAHVLNMSGGGGDSSGRRVRTRTRKTKRRTTRRRAH